MQKISILLRLTKQQRRAAMGEVCGIKVIVKSGCERAGTQLVTVLSALEDSEVRENEVVLFVQYRPHIVMYISLCCSQHRDES